jgi:hypothetical protein
VLSVDAVLGSPEPGYDVLMYNSDNYYYEGGAPLMIVVCGISIIVGLYSLRQGFVQKQIHRCIAWSIWICLCGVELYFVNDGVDPGSIDDIDDYWYGSPWAYGKYMVVGSTRLIWLCLLINWTLSSTGTS